METNVFVFAPFLILADTGMETYKFLQDLTHEFFYSNKTRSWPSINSWSSARCPLWGHKNKFCFSVVQGSHPNVFVAVVCSRRHVSSPTHTFRKQLWHRPTLIPSSALTLFLFTQPHFPWPGSLVPCLVCTSHQPPSSSDNV